MRRPAGRILLVLLAAVLLAISSAGASTQTASEYDVKAAFLYNFTKFVEWPPTAFPAERSQLRVCILGGNPFGKSLEAVIEGEEVQGRRLTLLRVDVLHSPGLCHILFISRSERTRIPAILTAVQGSPVLTVSETDGFLEKGGTINFKVQEGKVRFEINPSAAERGGLKMSSKLLRLATRIYPESRGTG
ncbi:MAG TPA: YfiR family protein [Thermoanaerobaculia bacterium]|nr:YfiR family protein [Thermoanaerobaculia bacterium]